MQRDTNTPLTRQNENTYIQLSEHGDQQIDQHLSGLLAAGN